MRDFNFYTPTKIFFGKGKEKNVGEIIKDYGFKRIMLQYGMGSISALHGITLSAWTFAGLTGNQLANWIVNKFGEFIDMDKWVNEGVKVVVDPANLAAGQTAINPTGYQTVLYVTIALYIVALLMSFIFVRKPFKEEKTEA